MAKVARVYETEASVAAADVALFEGSRISWAGIWSGFLVGLGVLLILGVLGLAVGITAVDIGPGENAGAGLGAGAAIWGGLSLLIALFLGGLVASRCGMTHDRATGVTEGALVWVLTTLLVIYLAGSGIGLLFGTAGSLLGGISRQISNAAPALGDLASGDINQVITRLRDPQTARTVAAATGLTPAQAQNRLNEIASRAEAARNNPAQATAEVRQGLQNLMGQAGQQLEQAAAAAQPYATSALWWTWLSLVVSLLAAVIGATIGANRAAHQVVRVG